MEQTEHSAFGNLGRRLVAWIVLIGVAVIAIKILIGVVAGIFSAILWTALFVAVVVVALWALKHI
jgi:hypothetical protein